MTSTDTRHMPKGMLDTEGALVAAQAAIRLLLKCRKNEKLGLLEPTHPDLWGTILVNAGQLGEMCRDLKGTCR